MLEFMLQIRKCVDPTTIRRSSHMLDAEAVLETDPPIVKQAKRLMMRRALRMFDFDIDGVKYTLTVDSKAADLFREEEKMAQWEMAEAISINESK